MFTGGITLLTGAAGVAWAKKTERDIVEYIETTLKFRRSKSMEIQPGANGASLPTPVPAIPPVVGAARPAPPRSAVAPPTDSPKRLSIAERVTEKSHAELQKLKDAHEAGILNDAEFASKKSDLQSKAMEWEVRFAIEDRSAKLRAALEGGILEQHEYQSKLAALEQSVREELNSQRKQAQKETQLGKLKSALDAGVLSHDEYQAKILALG